MAATECKPLVLLDIWRTCNKIRAAVFRNGFNLWDFYKPLDPKQSHLLSESKFVSVLAGPLKHVIGLSEQEICELTDYFRVPDGRVMYTQFCHVIHDNVPDLSKNKPLISGLEWEDPFHVNLMTVSEERKLRLLLTKIATIANAKRLILQPYFQDYELIAKNNGTVTITHFARVLYFLKIFLSVDDFQLLTKKFLKDSYTVNFIAFISALDYVHKYLEECGITDLGGDVLPMFPGRTVIAELPKLPRPEIGTVRTDAVFGVQKIFHPVLNAPIELETVETVIRRIQRYVLTQGVRIGEFFVDFDPMNCGRVTESVFRRCIDAIGVGQAGLCDLYLAPFEVAALVNIYRDPYDPARILWKVFVEDIESVNNKRELEKWPEIEMDMPLKEVVELPPKGNVYADLDEARITSVEDVVRIVKEKIRSWGIDIVKCFNDYDKLNIGHVTRNQFRQVLKLNCILLTDEQIYSLEQRYNDEMGFNYFKFLKEVDPQVEPQPMFEIVQDAKVKLSNKQFKMPVHPNETNIVEILAKIKKKLVCYKVRLVDSMKQYDPLNQLVISRQNFYRALDSKLELTETEVKTIMDVFACPLRDCCVEYKRFCDTVEEAFTQLHLDRAPLLEPVQHVVCSDGDHNFLNYEERQIVSLAMQKLAGQHTEGLREVLKLFAKKVLVHEATVMTYSLKCRLVTDEICCGKLYFLSFANEVSTSVAHYKRMKTETTLLIQWLLIQEYSETIFRLYARLMRIMKPTHMKRTSSSTSSEELT